MHKTKIVILVAVLIISVVLNLYFIFKPKPMITATSLGWEGYFEEYDCLGIEKIQCTSVIGQSLCRDYYCIGLLTSKRCYAQRLEKDNLGEEKISREDTPCR